MKQVERIAMGAGQETEREIETEWHTKVTLYYSKASYKEMVASAYN